MDPDSRQCDQTMVDVTAFQRRILDWRIGILVNSINTSIVQEMMAVSSPGPLSRPVVWESSSCFPLPAVAGGVSGASVLAAPS